MDARPMEDFTMWAAFKSGGQASNPAALSELVDEWIQMATQKTAGQRANKKGDISWDNLERVKMGILGEAVALKLSGDLNEIIMRRANQKHEVTEVCPHCECEITMMWSIESMGYKAFCPVCGERLMLCDECLHSGPDGEYTGKCDYCSKTDSCFRNNETGDTSVEEFSNLAKCQKWLSETKDDKEDEDD